MKHAFIVIDVNKYFLKSAPDDLALRIAEHISGSNYDLVVFATFKNKADSNFAVSLNWTKCGSAEDAALPEVFNDFINDQNVFEKPTYSAFAQTSLHAYLQQNQIEELTLCGIDTDACVLATAFSAFDLGYVTNVNFDLTYSNNDLEEAAQAIIKESILPQDKQAS